MQNIPNKKPCLPSEFKDEPRLDLTDFWSNAGDAKEKRDRFDNNFKPVDGNRYEDENEKVQMQEFEDKLHKPSLQHAEASKSRFITAFRITIGMNAANHIQFFYKAIYLQVTSENSKAKADIVEIDSEPYYRSENGELVEAELSEVDICKAKYYKNIRIDRYDEQEWKQFKKGNKWRHDTRSIIFSFQELYCLYHSQYGEPVSGNDYSKNIVITNGATFKKRLAKRRRCKHTILMSADPALQEIVYFADPAPGDEANLGHLCPPAKNCEKLEYDLI